MHRTYLEIRPSVTNHPVHGRNETLVICERCGPLIVFADYAAAIELAEKHESEGTY